MIPYPYNMVDMGGIDLAEANGTVVVGLYSKIVEAVNACGDVVLYNWKFAGIEIAPQHTSILLGNPITINGAVQVTEQDLVTVPGINPDPPEPHVLVPIEITENGEYYPADYDADGFSSVLAQVSSTGILEGDTPPSASIGSDGDYYLYNAPLDQLVIGITIIEAARGSDYSFRFWGARDIQLLFETPNGDVLLKDIAGANCYWAVGTGNFTAQSSVINGATNSYYEHSGLPGYWKITLPSSVIGYKVKGLSILPRDQSGNRDFYRSFSLGIWSSDREESTNLLSVVSSVEADWNFSNYTDFSFPPFELTGTTPYFYKKVNGVWNLVK